MFDHQTTMSLICKAQQGDEKAKEELITENLPLVKSVAKRYKIKQIEYDDLIQLGCLGFIKAIKNFDTSFGVKFSTYAVPMIAGEIKRFIRDDGAIKVSRSLKMLSSKIQNYIYEFCQQSDRQPTIKEIADEFQIDEQEVVFAMDSSKYPLSIYDKFDDNSNQCVLDKLSDGENSDELVDKLLLKDIILSLPERERNVIILRYYRDKTQSEIARMLGVSQVQISRIENKVIKQLRKELT